MDETQGVAGVGSTRVTSVGGSDSSATKARAHQSEGNLSRTDVLMMLLAEEDGKMKSEDDVLESWGVLRSALQRSFSFYDIKEIVGLAGLGVGCIAHLDQKQSGGNSKGQLMTAIDRALDALESGAQQRFIALVAEEVLTKRPETRQYVEEHLSRLGWSLSGNSVLPSALYDASVLQELPPTSQADLTKAMQRLRDGDLTGAISSACAAVDSATSTIYADEDLGDPSEASFQERYKCSSKARGVLPELEEQLNELGWRKEDIKSFCKNLEGSLNQAAYVMQSLRSRMGDVHGTKPILKPLVFDCLKWAELMLRLLVEG